VFRWPALGIALLAPFSVACLSALGVDFEPTLFDKMGANDAGVDAVVEGTDPNRPKDPDTQGQNRTRR